MALELSQHMVEGQNTAANPLPASLDVPMNGVNDRQSTRVLLRASFFEHARDPWPKPWKGSWGTLKTALGRTFSPSFGLPGGDEKRSMPAICAASFPDATRRGRDAVRAVHLVILDFDNAEEAPDPAGAVHPASGRPVTLKRCLGTPVTMAEVQTALQAAGVASVGWTTWSYTPDWPKFRVVLPLGRPVPPELWERYAEAAVTRLGLDPFRRALDLPVLHNAAALAFLPGSPAPESIQRFETEGAFLDVPEGAMLPLSPPSLAPWQREILTHRQSQIELGERWFQAYRVNGRPVDFKSLDLPALLEARGVKVGPIRPFKDGTKRRACCPWASEHTGGLDDDSVVLIHTPGSWPSFKCSHSGHVHLGLRDLIEWAWGRP